MKKITLLISACIASVFTLFAQDQLMVHQNNGNTTPFIASSVDSITIVSANNNTENKNEHQYVDMGLSVMWATCNIGASSPEEFGDYFAWGEKESKDEYTPENWKGTSSTTWEISNDPARNAWGGDWRVPTFWEFIELINNCKTQTCVKTSKDGYGILGTLFISKINGNKIFLPMAGHSTLGEKTYIDTMPFTSTGATGYYRASQYGLGIMLFPWNGIDFIENEFPFYVGESVRPVFGESTQTGNFEDYDIDKDLYKPEVLSLNKSNIELGVGEKTQLYATSSSNVSWEILSGEGIVEIEYQGYPQNTMVYINALSEGTAVIQATDGRTKAVCVINIKKKVFQTIATPSMDETTFLFQIEDAECDDFELYLMGIGGVWEDRPEMKFERVDGTQDWFQITIPALDESQSNFKIRANGDWTYEPKSGYEFLDGTDVYVAAGADSGNPNNLMILQPAGGKVLTFKVIEFVTPCTEPQDYTITLKTNYCGEEGTDVAITGGFPDSYWTEAIPMEKIDDNTYTYTIENGIPGIGFKFQSTEGGWYNQPVEFNEEYSEWLGLENFILGEETEILIDLTDYVWEACTPTE